MSVVDAFQAESAGAGECYSNRSGFAMAEVALAVVAEQWKEEKALLGEARAGRERSRQPRRCAGQTVPVLWDPAGSGPGPERNSR